ncbi:MAG: cache domain-containing protein [Gemmatimonadetes bacterium]|nr:cache domain-containing protein [Gemmatimonadota bacterium]
MKRSLWLPLMAAAVIAVVLVRATADRDAPQSEKARHIASLVDKAAGLIQEQGRAAAFAEFRKKGTMWFTGDIYIFADDMAGNVLLNPPSPQNEGKNAIDQKDANGKLLQRAMVELLKEKEAGWVDYMWPKPGQTKPSLKWSYVRRVNFDGIPGLVGAGFYPE